MKFFLVFPYYLYWHYTKGLKELTYNFWSIILFQVHFFSIKDLLRTLFSPYKRLREEYTGTVINVEAMLSTLVVNVIMRIVGLGVRVVILTIACSTLIFSFIIFPIIMIAWLVIPLALLFFIIVSIWAYIIHA